jgi:hypothetical protein
MYFLQTGVVGISEIIIRPGLINVDFADVRTIMGDAGTALMGIGKYVLRFLYQCSAVVLSSAGLRGGVLRCERFVYMVSVRIACSSELSTPVVTTKFSPVSNGRRFAPFLCYLHT